MAPTVLLHALQLINARNMLRSGVLQELRRAEPSVRIVAVSPLAKDPRFVADLAEQGVAVEYAPVYELHPVQQRLTSLAIERFVRTHPTRAVQLRWQRQEHVKGSANKQLALAGKSLLRRLPLPHRALLQASDALVPSSFCEPILQRHQPDVVAIGAGWQITEVPWHVTARRLGIPTVAVDVNWDAFDSKPGIIRGVDELLVWSEPMRQKAIARFGYRPAAVTVTGAPHLDRYFRPEAVCSREAFLAGLGFPSTARVITLAAVAPFNSPHDPERLEVLHDALMRDNLGPDARILVRLHPVDSLERWQRFRDLPGVRIETPFGEGPDGGSYETGESRRDMQHQVDTLIHTDVLVNVNSTISLEAQLVDTPVVMVAFDGRGEQLPYLQSDRRFLDYDHIASLVQTGGVRVAHSPHDLVAEIRAYLDHPERDRAERQHAAQTLYGWSDAGSAARVAQHLLRIAATRRGRFGG